MNNRTDKPALLVVTSTFPRWRGDTEPPFVFELSRRLTRDWDVHVLAPHASGTKREEIMDGITVSRFPYLPRPWQRLAYEGGILPKLKRRPSLAATIPFFLAGELIALVRKLRSRRFAVVHAHWLLPQGLLALVALRLARVDIPLLTTSHGGDMYGLRGRHFDMLRRFVLRGSTGVTVVSRAMAEAAMAMGAKQERLRIIPMGVDLRHTFVPPSAPRSGKHILFVGRLVEKKGLTYLIKAMHRIVELHPDIVLTVVGDGPEKRKLRDEAEALGVSDRIIFAGSVVNTKLPVYYQEADICVFPSVVADSGDQEGFGLVLVEAMGCECTVVSSDLPAVRDIVIPGTTGCLVPEKNPELLANCILKLFENDGDCSSLGLRGREYVLERYDWYSIASLYSWFLNELIQKYEVLD